MARPKLRPEPLDALSIADAPAPSSASSLAAIGEAAWTGEDIGSPARDLQSRLTKAYTAPIDDAAGDDLKWSARRSAAFMIGASLLLWGAIGWGLLHLLAA